MASSATSTSAASRHPFESRIDDVRPQKSDINALILDYLTTEGYPSAAEKFSLEANVEARHEPQSVKARNEISHAIHMGNIESAIKSLNDLNPTILDDDPSLHFALLRLHLIELIRTCHQPGEDITPAIDFATTHLAPRAPTSPEFLEDLERTMTLLIFGPENLEPPLTRLLHPDLRREVADRVNKAILQKENQRRDAAIRNLVKMRVWGENVGREKGRDYPAEGEWEMGFDREAEVKDEEDENMIG